jgi:hypothetical protein
MDNIIYIIKIWAILQLIIVISLILIFIATQIILKYKNKVRQKKIDKINHLLTISINDASVLNDSTLQFFNQSIVEFILCFERQDKHYQENDAWKKIKVTISDRVFKPQIKLLAASPYWFKRYLATRCFHLGVNIEDENVLFNLLSDKVLLVAINATMLILNNPSSRSINEIINVFSKERHILRSTLENILSDQPIKRDDQITDTIIKRLYVEKNIYCKIICYELLCLLRPPDKIDPIYNKHILTDNIDLKIAVLKYLSHTDTLSSKNILLNYLNDAHDEVRTTVVKLLGKTGDKMMIPYLTSKLSDKAWWVRINSAHALANLGEEGIYALKSISPHDDKFAYETAQAYLGENKNMGKSN